MATDLTKITPTTTTPSTPPPPPPTTTTTPVSTTPLSTTTEASNGVSACVLASTLSATFVILFFIICGVVYFLYRRKKQKSVFSSEANRKSVDETHLPETPETSFSRNKSFPSDAEYDVPPKREEPLPRKMGPKDTYLGTPRSHEDYSVPPTRNDNCMKPPLPPNIVRKLEAKKGQESQPDEHHDSYYLDMEGINDAVYQNYETSQDDIYVNN